MMREFAHLRVTESSQVGEARRRANEMARIVGFDETQAGKLGIVVTEIATNLVQHAQGGELLLRTLRTVSEDGSDRDGVEALALDRGPGMANPARCLEDGYSTAGTAGQGLGAISRMADEFDLFSQRDVGTLLFARVCARARAGGGASPRTRHPLEVGAVSVMHPGEQVCGDGWGVQRQSERSRRTLIAVIDGLGHGPVAAEASREALRVFGECAEWSGPEILDAMHGALRSTRGAAVAVAEILPEEGCLRYTGVGNIAASILTPPTSTSLVSHNGTVGHQVRKVQEFSYPFPQEALLVMHSDGLTSQWRLDKSPGLVMRHPTLIAGALYRDFTRGRDDVTVVAVRERSRPVA